LQAVSKHLKVLEDAGLVTRSQDAQRRPRHLEAEVFDLMPEPMVLRAMDVPAPHRTHR